MQLRAEELHVDPDIAVGQENKFLKKSKQWAIMTDVIDSYHSENMFIITETLIHEVREIIKNDSAFEVSLSHTRFLKFYYFIYPHPTLIQFRRRGEIDFATTLPGPSHHWRP